MTNKRKIGFIGMGNMGNGMAKNLVKKGFEVTVYDLRKEPVDELRALGATVANSPKGVAEASDVIISVVRNDAQTDEVIFGRNGVWEGIRRGSVIIISSTIDPVHCQSIAAAGKEKGVSVLDAAVSGASVASQAGILTFMVGGEEAVYQECRPIFEVMGKNIFYLGDIGMGQVFKLVNNIMWFTNVVGLSEGLTLGLKAGLKLERMLEVVRVSTGNSWVAENWDWLLAFEKHYGERKLDSPLALIYKDIDLALNLAKKLGVFLPLTGLTSQMEISTFFPKV